MQLMLSAVVFIAIVSLTIFIVKTSAKEQKRAIVGLIFLSTSSVAIALALNSMYSLIFFAAQLIFFADGHKPGVTGTERTKEKKLMPKESVFCFDCQVWVMIQTDKLSVYFLFLKKTKMLNIFPKKYRVL